MNSSSKPENIFGIKLLDDVSKVSVYEGDIISSIICDDLSMRCDSFRHVLNKRIPSLPHNYKFMSKDSLPIEKKEESQIEISQLNLNNIITIQRQFDQPRLGVKWHKGESLGFIFINYNSSLLEARKTILNQLSDKFMTADSKFEFLDKNEWPVAHSQESILSVWDVSVRNICNLNKLSIKRRLTSQELEIKKKNLKLTNKENFKDLERHVIPASILISYVHAEASIHARDLKRELINMGIKSVFLDVDDIPAGKDWQDIINSALNECSAFVALVTPRYGETRWTNREAKLADDKEKLIIPVSFLEKWPPDQLAIQFLSLQYIPWILQQDFPSSNNYLTNDITHWDQRSIHRVAKEITKLCSSPDVSTPDSLSLLDTRNSAHNGFSFSSSPVVEQSSQKKHLIIISAHYKQKPFVEKLVSIFKEDHNFWYSLNEATENGNVGNYFDDSQLSESSPSLENFSNHMSSRFTYQRTCENDLSKSCSKETKETSGNVNVRCNKSEFKKKIKEASLAIIIISDEYTNSRYCKQQAFYCEQRVEVIVIKFGKVLVDNVLQNLYPEQDMLEITSEQIGMIMENSCDSFITKLKKEITKSLENYKRNDKYKDNIQKQVNLLKSELAIEHCVYIIGGTNSVSKTAEAFCINLGCELAKVKNLTLVTEGFFGAGDLVGKNFCEEKEIAAKGKPPLIYHVVPVKDPNANNRARQKEDGSFEKIPYGKTLFYGQSVNERDDIVSSTFKVCILIEGGERSACLAEKFLWNDCTVVPVLFNNRAIFSKKCLAACISKPPCGVIHQDWNKLEKCSNAEELVKTVKKIISDLLKARQKCLEIKQ